MKYFIILSIFCITFLQAEINIIASPMCKVETLSMHEVKNLFMAKKRLIGDERIIILENSDENTYTLFTKKYLKKSTRKMKVYWTRMLFTGKKIPPKKLSSEELALLDTSKNCYLSYVEFIQKPENWNSINIK